MTDKKPNLSHVDANGQVAMVDVDTKPATHRQARASARLTMQPTTLQAIKDNSLKKGDVLTVAKIAAIAAAKKTSDLIPLCHPLALSHIAITIEPADDKTLIIVAQVKTQGATGVEMEALTAVAVAALTIYDMVKAIDKGVIIGDIKLLEKSGGRSGHFVAA